MSLAQSWYSRKEITRGSAPNMHEDIPISFFHVLVLTFLVMITTLRHYPHTIARVGLVHTVPTVLDSPCPNLSTKGTADCNGFHNSDRTGYTELAEC